MSRTSGSAYRRRRRVILSGEPVCGICGQPIDKTLKWPDPMSPSADHVVPHSKGGSDFQLMPAHLGCNRKRQAKDLGEVAVRRNSREW